MPKTQLAQGARRPGGKLRDVKRPACFSVADRRVSKLRHDCRTARSQACSVGRGARRTPTDRVRTRRRRRSVPWVPRLRRSNPIRRTGRPTEGAINPDRKTRCPADEAIKLQPPDRCPAGEGLITPTAERARWEKGLSLQPTERGRGRRAYHSVDSANAACEGLSHSASAASLLGDLFGAARALGKCPQVSRAGNAGKA